MQVDTAFSLGKKKKDERHKSKAYFLGSCLGQPVPPDHYQLTDLCEIITRYFVFLLVSYIELFLKFNVTAVGY